MNEPNPFTSQPTTADLEARESGAGRVPTAPPGELPAGGGKYPVPHHLSKVGLVNQTSRTYRYTFDEAVRHSRQNAVAILRDLVIRNALMTRWTPVVQLSWSLIPSDPTDNAQVEGAAKLTKVIERTPKLQDFFQALLWGEWFGRQGVSQTFEWVQVFDEQWLVVRDFKPINGDSLIARWSGDWGQLVNGQYDGDKEATDRGYAHFYTPEEREAVVVHTAPGEDSDFYDYELAGQIKGSGLRGHVYWTWWFRANFQALLADFSERFSQGIWIGWYEYENAESKQEMENTLAGYKNNRHLLFPRDQDGKTAYGLEVKEVGTANPQFIRDAIREMDELLHSYITGRSLNEVDVPVGGDGAGLVEDRISRQVKFSGKRLSETLTAEWLPVLAKYNTPGVPPPRFVFNIDAPNAGEVLGYARAIHELGGPIDLDHLYEVAGLPVPAADSMVASKLQPMSPMMDQAPPGVPVAADPQQAPPQPAPPQPSPQPAPTTPPVDQPQPTLLG